jgi:hypothetical protein
MSFGVKKAGAGFVVEFDFEIYACGSDDGAIGIKESAGDVDG